MNYIFLLFFFEIVLLAGAFLATKKDIIAPSVVICAMFVLGTFVAILNLGKWDNIGAYGLSSCLILTAGLLVFVLAEQLVGRSRAAGGAAGPAGTLARADESGENAAFSAFDIQTWKIIALILFNACIDIWFYINIRDFVVSREGDAGNMIAAYRRIMVAASRSSGDGVLGTGLFLSQMLKVVEASAYISAFCIVNNILAGRIKDRKNIGLAFVCALSFIPKVITGGRSEFFHLAVAVIVEYYILWHQKKGWDKSLVKQYILVGITAVVMGIPLFYLTLRFMGRGGSGTAGANAWEHASIYLGCSVALFDQFIRSPGGGPAYFGEETFVGIQTALKRLGLSSHVATKHFLESRPLTSDGSLKGNTYTFFRRPYHDFGFAGMLVFTALVAFFFAWIYHKKIKNRARSKSSDYWVLAYGYLYYWVFFALFEQKSVYYLSPRAVLLIAAILIGFFLMAHVQVFWKEKKITVV